MFNYHSNFLHRLDNHLEQHLSDEYLDIAKLAHLMLMSRSNLHRKLKQTTGMNTSEYIRDFRIKKAILLMSKHSEWSIYQIALEVGFSCPAYFSRSFKRVLGSCPTVWRKDQILY